MSFRLEGPFPPAPNCVNTRGYGSACFCRGRRYTCPGCRRFVPYCYGAADEHAELCDDCASVACREHTLPNDGLPRRVEP
jgi:hypothetical protein